MNLGIKIIISVSNIILAKFRFKNYFTIYLFCFHIVNNNFVSFITFKIYNL